MARALVIVDYQNDFNPPDGALAVPGGSEIAPRLNQLARSGQFDLVIATRDWHPADHASFEVHGGTWPVHCVQNTPGAELHPDLDPNAVDVVIDKGEATDTDGYSAFENPELAGILRDHGIGELTVTGLATNFCVKNTALDAMREGFEVTLDTSAMRGIDLQPGDSERALTEVAAAGGTLV